MIEEQLLGQLQGNYELFIVPFLEKKIKDGLWSIFLLDYPAWLGQ